MTGIDSGGGLWDLSAALKGNGAVPGALAASSDFAATDGWVKMEPEQLEEAMLDPEAVFGVPEKVLGEANLSREQKIEILRRWEYNAAEEAVALEEGMPGEESDLLRRILVALGELTGPLDLRRSGPTKQHGLTREAMKSPIDKKA